MNAKLTRLNYLSNGIFGSMICGDIKFSTLEHAFAQADGTYLPAIPKGNYICSRFMSPHLGYEVFELHDVPGHDHILIHIGNFNNDSEGCILIGKETDLYSHPEMIKGSKEGFKEFMMLQDDYLEFNLQVE